MLETKFLKLKKNFDDLFNLSTPIPQGQGKGAYRSSQHGLTPRPKFYEIKEWELFDNQKDPEQMHDVCTSPEYAKTVVDLKAELSRLCTLYGDTDGDAQRKPSTHV